VLTNFCNPEIARLGRQQFQDLDWWKRPRSPDFWSRDCNP